jgi:hypothetical protein
VTGPGGGPAQKITNITHSSPAGFRTRSPIITG